MSFYASVSDTKFFVPSECSARIIAKARKIESDFEFLLDDDGNITDVELGCDNPRYDVEFAMFQDIAPIVKEGSYIDFSGEQDSHWRWVFKDGTCQEIQAKVVWE